MRTVRAVLVALATILGATGWSGEPTTILVAAAASLQYSFTELIPDFQAIYPWITVEGTYDSSGKLQAQIENGLEADVFLSAASRQMEALVASGFVDPTSVVDLLENRIVLIRPAGTGGGNGGGGDFTAIAEAATVALGDPASVPAGQYAQEALTSLGLWEGVAARASFGTNVTEVLHWVAEGSADAGIVYATDAATTDRVTVVAEAPAGSLAQPVIYPVGVLRASGQPEAARLFVDYLGSDKALAVFARYGFSPNR
ncbi:MAG: molybdate ABC transporter substrate-binding protein [Planctomycetes bacterium]|nr:molybdate ABC transporter substrate-binding protein [Planctomycetota bacterium]